MDWLNAVGACLTVGMGCLGLFFPARAASFTGLTATTIPGRSEFRATYGGLFVFAGALPLLTMDPTMFLLLGLSWAGAGFGRVVSILADDANSLKNWIAVLFEATFALLLMIGTPFELLIAAVVSN